MAEINLAPGAYTSIVMQQSLSVSLSFSPATIIATGTSEAAYVSAIWATNRSVGSYVISLTIYDGATTRYLKNQVLLKGAAKLGNSVNLLDGVPLYLPEGYTVSAVLEAYLGSGAGTGVDVTPSWAIIT